MLATDCAEPETRPMCNLCLEVQQVLRNVTGLMGAMLALIVMLNVINRCQNRRRSKKLEQSIFTLPCYVYPSREKRAEAMREARGRLRGESNRSLVFNVFHVEGRKLIGCNVARRSRPRAGWTQRELTTNSFWCWSCVESYEKAVMRYTFLHAVRQMVSLANCESIFQSIVKCLPATKIDSRPLEYCIRSPRCVDVHNAGTTVPETSPPGQIQ